MMKIGILGGTFDPPHKAHLQIAERAIKQFDLDKVLFIPSGNPWQKKYATSFIHRFEMTKILIEGSNKFEISDIEKSEEIPSYTFDTLKKLNHKKDNLYFILGSDTAINIRTWNNYEKLSELTNFLIALRKEDSANSLKENFPFDYELISPLVAKLIEQSKSPTELIEMGYEESIIYDISKRLRINEFKRRQAAPTLRVTSKAFGIGRRVPIINQFDELV